ncbi:MAG: alpha/beta hydrolase [Bryobacterales bacterium]|nr:alpha/beta hydrolase [Bryobacterales bacterium]
MIRYLLLAACLWSLPVTPEAGAQAPRVEKRQVEIRGKAVDLYLVSAPPSTSKRPVVLFAPGDGGWRGAAIDFARQIASWGYDVIGLDTRQYLSTFTGETTLTETDIIGDIGRIARSLAPGRSVTLAGWSAGAGLMVLAASGEKQLYHGVVTMGLADTNVMGWRLKDNLSYLTGRLPDEPTFSGLRHIPRVAPLPLAMIQSSRDEYVPVEEARRLFAAAGEPKRFVLVEAKNHRFEGNQPEFFRQLRAMIEWVNTTER